MRMKGRAKGEIERWKKGDNIGSGRKMWKMRNEMKGMKGVQEGGGGE